MNGSRTRSAWFFVLAAVLLSALAGFMTYNVGVSHGLAQTAVAQGVPAPPYGYPYWRPWEFGFGFPILFFVLLWFVLLRGLWVARGATGITPGQAGFHHRSTNGIVARTIG